MLKYHVAVLVNYFSSKVHQVLIQNTHRHLRILLCLMCQCQGNCKIETVIHRSVLKYMYAYIGWFQKEKSKGRWWKSSLPSASDFKSHQHLLETNSLRCLILHGKELLMALQSFRYVRSHVMIFGPERLCFTTYHSQAQFACMRNHKRHH